MRLTRLVAGVAGTAAVAALVATAVAPAASAADQGTRSLAVVLGVNPNAAPTFDHNGHNYNILTDIINKILKANPSSPLTVLANGKVAATCFIPNDQAFRLFVQQAFPSAARTTERQVYTALTTNFDNATLQAVVLYHCTAGTIDSAAAAKANGAVLRMLNGGATRVYVNGGRIYLIDKGLKYTNPWVVQPDINMGNAQIAHGISRVLLPLDLPSPVKA